MSLTPIQLKNDTITSDAAYWADIWLRVHATVLECVAHPRQLGGHTSVGTDCARDCTHRDCRCSSLLTSCCTILGTRKLLIVTLYATGSRHDYEVQTLFNAGLEICSKENRYRDTSQRLLNDVVEVTPCNQTLEWDRALKVNSDELA